VQGGSAIGKRHGMRGADAVGYGALEYLDRGPHSEPAAFQNFFHSGDIVAVYALMPVRIDDAIRHARNLYFIF
jgi:hypothetical protein